ncbi:transporter [Stenotrophomonas maltophilia]|uniref:transporter n=1 Tax=Stenotrophomonas maltophilia TaxID=40324 RepID=UPI00289396B8|nr:transporter [Stenotrophomonas maltophilia]MDT3501994.1 transporter [Stenotrophomonas maltophilia]
MPGLTDGKQQQRDAQWSKFSKLFWPAMAMSAALTACAELLHRTGVYPQSVFTASDVDARTSLYVGLMYVFLVPTLFLRMRQLLSHYPVPWNPRGKRWLLGLFSLILCSGMIMLPVIVLAVGDDAAGRGRSVYRLFTGSLFGTCLVGGVLAYGAAMAAWLLSATPRLLFPKPPSR